MSLGNEFFLSLALKEAWKYQFLTYPNPAVGCVVTNKYGKILAINAHKAAGEFHAERLCVEEILQKYGSDELNGSTFYVTLEPCSKYGRTPPCHELLIKYKANELVVGSVDFSQNGINELKNAGIKVTQGILQKECDELLKPFSTWLKNEPFVLFKLAMNLNANIEGAISNEVLKNYFHEIRSKLDALVVCGNTLRTDNPLLDARYSKSKRAPDLLVFSRNAISGLEFFNISKANRSIFIHHEPQNLKNILKSKNMRFAMIEGGFAALELFKNQIDWLFLQRGNTTYKNSANFKLSLNPIYQSTTKELYNKPHESQHYGFYEIKGE